MNFGRYISGSIHYFRVPEGLWRDRLTKIRAAGFNAIQFVVMWNLHQRFPGNDADFSGTNYDYNSRWFPEYPILYFLWSTIIKTALYLLSNSYLNYILTGQLNIEKFVEIAKELGLFVLFRPGPYTCAERNGGGLPWWLYKLHPQIKVKCLFSFKNKNMLFWKF